MNREENYCHTQWNVFQVVKVLPSSGKWTELEDIMLSEIIQFFHMRKKKNNEDILKEEEM